MKSSYDISRFKKKSSDFQPSHILGSGQDWSHHTARTHFEDSGITHQKPLLSEKFPKNAAARHRNQDLSSYETILCKEPEKDSQNSTHWFEFGVH